MSLVSPPEPRSPRRRLVALSLAVGITSALATALVFALALNISQRKREAKSPFFRVVELTDDTVDPAVWGRNFPLQYEGYARTVDQVRTRHGGSEAVPRTPTRADPRSVVARSRLEEDPRLKRMWAGYAFSEDFREERGHAYMLMDQTFTRRQQVAPQTGACLHCHASVYTVYKELGGGGLTRGFEKLDAMPYPEARKWVEHPVSCIDCHEPQTMRLRITRPAFMEAMAQLKAAQGSAGYDVNRDATRQEMRAFVCAQCHGEYSFQGPRKRLRHPWEKGLKVEDILASYEESGHVDWTHADSGTPALKAQHPEFELWSQGLHARSGVVCADCHMPYQRVGALKVSDHHVRSPLLNVRRACQTCHPFSESELLARVETIQERTFHLRNQALDALVGLIQDLETVREEGRPETELAPVQALQRRAQFMLDFIVAENSMGFHAPQEAARILAESMNLSRQGQILLRDPGFQLQLPSSSPPRARH